MRLSHSRIKDSETSGTLRKIGSSEDSRTQVSFPTFILSGCSWRRNKQTEEEACFCRTFYIKGCFTQTRNETFLLAFWCNYCICTFMSLSEFITVICQGKLKTSSKPMSWLEVQTIEEVCVESGRMKKLTPLAITEKLTFGSSQQILLIALNFFLFFMAHRDRLL